MGQLQTSHGPSKGTKASSASRTSSQRQPLKTSANAETEALRQTRAFVRAFSRARTDPSALATLLLQTPSSVLTHAVETSLSDDHIFAIVTALLALEQSADASVAVDVAARRRPLTHSQRFRFALTMAPDNVRRRFDSVVDATDATVSTESAPAGASSSVMCA